MKEISLVVPMYNEEEMIPLFFEEINKVLNKLVDYKFEIVCVNDGSKDNTLSLLKKKRQEQSNIHKYWFHLQLLRLVPSVFFYSH